MMHYNSMHLQSSYTDLIIFVGPFELVFYSIPCGNQLYLSKHLSSRATDENFKEL